MSLIKQLITGVLSVLLLVMVLSACSDDGSADNSGGDSDFERIPCNYDEDCLDQGMMCSVTGFCVPIPDYLQPSDGDAEEPEIEIDLGNPEERQLTCPMELDFGEVLMGQVKTLPVSLANIGTEDVTIGSIMFTDEQTGFSLLDLPSFPTIIEPGMQMSFDVRYEPDGPGEERANINIASNSDSNNPDLCSGTIRVTTSYSGESEVIVTPEEIYFGNVAVDDIGGADVPVRLCNLGTGNKVVGFTGATLSGGDSGQFATKFTGTEPNYNSPVYIPPGDEPTGEEETLPENCYEFMLNYSPDEITTWPIMHIAQMVLYVDADNISGDEIAVDITGSSDPDSVYVSPSDIDFGSVDIDTTKLQELTFTNQTGGPVEIKELKLEGMDCIEFEVLNAEHEAPFTMEKDEVINDVGVAYTPDAVGLDQNCALMIVTDRECPPGEQCPATYIRTPLRGYGREPNSAPIALISRSTTQLIEVTEPIEDVDVDQSLQLDGGFSYDEEDGSVSRYEWDLIRPEDSGARILPNEEYSVVSIKPDKVGDYFISLTVYDSEDVPSIANEISLIVGSGVDDDRMQVVMTFTGQSDMNVQLEWWAPNNQFCSDAVMSFLHTCNLGDYGYATVHESTSSFDHDGNTEKIVYGNPLDGTYKTKVTFLDNCGGLALGGYCLNPQSSEVEVRWFIGNDPVPRYQKSVTLDTLLQSKEWSMTLGSEGWSEPFR